MTRLGRRLSFLPVFAVLLVPISARATSPAAQDPLLSSPAPGAPVTSATQLAYVIRGGCPYNLDKVCHRNRHGRLICHCAS